MPYILHSAKDNLKLVYEHFNAQKLTAFRTNNVTNCNNDTLPSHILKTVEENFIEVLQIGNFKQLYF